MCRILGFAFVFVLALPGCSRTPTSERPLATWPVPAEQLPAAIAGPVPQGFGTASWALDPAFPKPGPAATELHILVWERACSSGSPTTGRMSAPAVSIAETTMTISIGVRSLTGIQACPGPPGTPATMTLPEPLGARTLVDGGRVPSGPPDPPF
jgi:hypothetical protein